MIPPRWLLALACAACYGCAGFRAEMLPQLDRDEIARGARLPAISYEFNPGPEPRATGDHVLAPGDANEQLFCNAFVAARRGPAANDLHIDLFFRDEERTPMLSGGLVLLCLCSAGIIPAYGQEQLSLRARVESEGKLVREYAYEDRVTSWVGLVFLPLVFTNNAELVTRDVRDNLLLHLLRDLRKDLPQIAPAAQP